MQTYKIKKADKRFNLLNDFYKVPAGETRFHIKYALVKDGLLYKTDSHYMLVMQADEMEMGYYEIIKHGQTFLLIETEETGEYPSVSMVTEKEYPRSYGNLENDGGMLERSCLFSRIVRAMGENGINFKYLTKTVSTDHLTFNTYEEEPHKYPIKIIFEYADLYIMTIKVIDPA